MRTVKIGPLTRSFLIALVGIAIALDLAKVAHRRMSLGGDFDISRKFGARFLKGEYLYNNGLHFVYLPSAAMCFSPLAILPTPLAFAASFGIAILCLWLTIRMWNRVASLRYPVLARQGFIIGLIAIVLASHFIVRDLDDGGPHIILVAIVTAGIYAAFKQRPCLSAMWFGLATAIKVTPGLFVPFLLWKREWRLAAYSALAGGCWISLPMLRIGPANWYREMHDWLMSAGGFAIGRNPAMLFRGGKVIHNQALHAAVLYLLEKSSISPELANVVAVGVTLGVVVLFCWRTHQRYTSLEDPTWPSESAALMVLMILLSPITWEQHLVLMLPALYLIAAEIVGTSNLETGIAAAMIVFALLSLVFTRDLLGKQNYAVLLACHVQTLCVLIVFSIALLKHPMSSSVEQVAHL